MILILVIIGILLIFGALCFQGWVVWAVWNYIALQFPNPITISFWIAVGIVIIFNIILYKPKASVSVDD